MEEIDLLIQQLKIGENIQIRKLEKERVISDGYFSISLCLETTNSVFIYFKWSFGLIGKLIFKRKLKRRMNLYNEIKKILIEHNFEVKEINLIKINSY